MRLVQSPLGSRLCGHACVAMLAGVKLDRAVAAVGHVRPTTTATMIRALRQLGVRCEDRLRLLPRKNAVPWLEQHHGPFLLHAKSPQPEVRGGHWLVWAGRFFDPSFGLGARIVDGVVILPCGYRLTSFLKIH